MLEDTRILSIKELTRYIRMKLESDARLQHLWLRGEISNFTHHSSGHMYFTLKDADSRIRTIMFASYNQKLAFRPKEGMKVIARGDVMVYERDGQYQFYVQHMQPDGIGSLFIAFEQLKERLREEGLFAPERKRSIPRYPAAIGVITSPTGAAVKDILITLQRRQPGVTVQLYPVLVQGDQAAASLVQAIEAMNRQREVDVLIIGRGGGALEELWAFNEEVVARAIAASTIPIISAVGHETDFTISDFVADLRAPTPTAAAELAVMNRDDLRQHLSHMEQRLRTGMNRVLNHNQERLLRGQQAMAFRTPGQWIAQQAGKVERLTTQLYSILTAITKQRRMHAVSLMQQLNALSPLQTMSRGYSLIYNEQGTKQIRIMAEVQLGDIVRVKLIDGTLHCHVRAMEKEGVDHSDGK